MLRWQYQDDTLPGPGVRCVGAGVEDEAALPDRQGGAGVRPASRQLHPPRQVSNRPQQLRNTVNVNGTNHLPTCYIPGPR